MTLWKIKGEEGPQNGQNSPWCTTGHLQICTFAGAVWQQVHGGHCLLEHEVPLCWIVAIGAARPSAVVGHRQRADEEALGPHALLIHMRRLVATKPCSVQMVGVQGNFAGGATNCSDPLHGGRPAAAHRSCWRARPSEGPMSTFYSLCLVFRQSSKAQRRTQLRGPSEVGHKLFPFPVCVFESVCMCVCVFCLCSACMPSCDLPLLQALGRAVEERSDCRAVQQCQTILQNVSSHTSAKSQPTASLSVDSSHSCPACIWLCL